jgi:hypothetical protein
VSFVGFIFQSMEKTIPTGAIAKRKRKRDVKRVVSVSSIDGARFFRGPHLVIFINCYKKIYMYRIYTYKNN